MEISVSATVYSFQALINTKISAVTIPGAATGRRILKRACTRLQPSIAVSYTHLDEAGREYFESLASDRKSGRYTRVSGTRYSFDESDYRTYTSVDGVLEPVIYPATGQPVYAFEDGKTYNLSVRAVKIGEDGKEVYGDWSNAFAYKVTASDAGTSEKPAAVSGVNVNTCLLYTSVPT